MTRRYYYYYLLPPLDSNRAVGRTAEPTEHVVWGRRRGFPKAILTKLAPTPHVLPKGCHTLEHGQAHRSQLAAGLGQARGL